MYGKMDESITLMRIKELKGTDSQETFAKKINSTQSNVSKMLNGTPPSASTLKALAEIYQVSVDWLLGLSDEKNLSKQSTFDAHLLTYADVMVVLDVLYRKESISVGTSYNGYGAEPDSATIDVNDRVLRYFLDNRMRYVGGSQDIYDIWLERAQTHFADLPLLEWNNDATMLFDGNLPSIMCDEEIVKLADAIANDKPLKCSLSEIVANMNKLPFD